MSNQGMLNLAILGTMLASKQGERYLGIGIPPGCEAIPSSYSQSLHGERIGDVGVRHR